MTDFAYSHIGTWKDGEMPKHDGATVILSYDQESHSYYVHPSDMGGFIGWIAMIWGEGRDPQEEDESDAGYLERIGVSVQEV